MLRSLATSLALGLFVIGARAQSGAYNSPLDVATSSRSIAMGEALAAVPKEPMALMSNPAGLAGLDGIGVSYSQRSINWMSGLEDFRFHGASAFIALPFGVFGIQYNRFSMGEVAISTPSSPQGYGTATMYAHSIAAGFGVHLTGNLSAGVTAKHFDIIYDVSAPTTSFETDFTPAYLVDGGIQYSIPIRTADSAAIHTLTGGLAIQNLGTNLRMSNLTESGSSSEQMPRYLRVGASYGLDILPGDPEGLHPVSLLFTAEYRTILNEAGGMYNDRSFWGFGAECTALEIISLRLGGVVMPYTSIYGEKGKLMFRTGMGLRLPLATLGVPAPLVLSGEFAIIPIDSHPNNFMWGFTSSLSAFTVGLEYVAP
jgi:hypothetical protein